MAKEDTNTDLERNEIIKALTILKKPAVRGNLKRVELKLIADSIRQLEIVIRNLTY
jgi:hypothetical protein